MSKSVNILFLLAEQFALPLSAYCNRDASHLPSLYCYYAELWTDFEICQCSSRLKKTRRRSAAATTEKPEQNRNICCRGDGARFDTTRRHEVVLRSISGIVVRTRKCRAADESVVRAVGANSIAAEKRPNILFVLVDDQSPFDLKVYDSKSSLKTPIIDRLAAGGMVFDGAYHMC